MVPTFVRCSASTCRLSRVSQKPSSKVPTRSIILTGVSLIALTPAMLAQTVEIDTEIDTPVATDTADNGAPADIEITSDGTILIEQVDGTIAVTMNSDNAIQNDGTIQIDESDDSVGVLIEANHAGDITGSGDIFLYDNYEREDDDDDDDLDGPYAIGTNRTAILLQAGGVHTGDISLSPGAQIVVEGNESYGIRLQSELDGRLSLDSSINVTGDNARAIQADQDISGDVLISAAVQARGEHAQAVELAGDIGGALTIESAVTSSGFASTALSNYVAPLNVDEDTPDVADRIDAEDLLDNLGAVTVRGSVANGVLINGNVDTFISEEDAEDETKDTIEDFDENRTTGSIASVGSGTALLIAAEDSDLVLGTVIETVRDTLDDDEDEDIDETLATFSYAYGLINRGTISANGLNIGFDASALRIEGAADGSADAIVDGGIDNSGFIQATAYDADAVAASFGTGADIGRLDNSGTISAQATAISTETAVAISIEDGAILASLVNDQGTISAQTSGESGSATAIVDQSGTLTIIENSGLISARLIDNGTVVDTPGDAIAIDLRSHDAATGVTLLQDRATPVDDINGDDVIDNDDVETPSIVGDILLGAGNDRFDLLAGAVTGDTDFGGGDGTFIVRDSTLTGDVLFSDGTHALDFGKSAVTGDLHFDTSVASISLINGASFEGSIITDASSVDLMVADSDLNIAAGNRSDLNTLTITGDSDLTFHVDPHRTDGVVFNVAGVADLGSDVTITPILESIARDPFSQVLIAADTLIFSGSFDDDQVTGIPFLYNLELEQTNTELEIFFDLKTAEELNLDDNQTRAYDPLINIFVTDEALGAAIATIHDEAEFNQVYDLLLPQRTNASQQFLATQWNAAFGALNDHLGLLGHTERSQVGIWTQEYLYSLDEQSSVQNPGYNGDGLGVAIGIDRALGPLTRIGAMSTYASGSFSEKTGGYNPISTSSLGVGLYALQKLGPVELRASGQVAKVDFSSNRDFEIDDLIYQIDGHWTGTSQAASVSAVSELDLGWGYVRPEVSADWFAMHQNPYSETGISSSDSLYAHVSDVDTDELSVAANVVIGKQMQLGGGIARAELSGGYRSIASETPYAASVSFGDIENVFDLLAPDTASDAVLLGVALGGEGGLVSSKVGYDVKISDDGMAHVLGGTLRLKF